MKKLVLASSVLLAAALLPAGASAQTTAPASAAPAITGAKSTLKDAAEGEVRKVDKDAKKITLKHGPIKNLDMPGMTMVFQVKDVALLDKLAAGDKVVFTAEQQQGAYVVTAVEKVATQ